MLISNLSKDSSGSAGVVDVVGVVVSPYVGGRSPEGIVYLDIFIDGYTILMDKKFLIFLFVIVIGLCLVYSNPSKLEKMTNDKKLILTYYRSGGFGGLVRRIEIFSNRTYIVYDRDQIIKSGKLDDRSFMAADELSGMSSVFLDSYSKKIQGSDILYHSLKIGEKDIDLGMVGSNSDLIPKVLKNNVDIISKLV
jgi:hypothetical protein